MACEFQRDIEQAAERQFPALGFEIGHGLVAGGIDETQFLLTPDDLGGVDGAMHTDVKMRRLHGQSGHRERLVFPGLDHDAPVELAADIAQPGGRRDLVIMRDHAQFLLAPAQLEQGIGRIGNTEGTGSAHAESAAELEGRLQSDVQFPHPQSGEHIFHGGKFPLRAVHKDSGAVRGIGAVDGSHDALIQRNSNAERAATMRWRGGIGLENQGDVRGRESPCG